jgi:hypothetical protein
MRPLVQLSKKGVEFDRIPGTETGELVLDAVEGMIKENTVAIVMTHASNIVGTVNPLAEVGKICRRHGLRFIVDCAQTAGILPISMKEMNIDALCFTGHKSLLGPQGTGGFLIEAGAFARADFFLHQCGSTRKSVIRSDGGNEDQIQRISGNTGIFQSGQCGFGGHIRGRFRVSGDVPFFDAGTGDDPFVSGIDNFFQIGIGQYLFRDVTAGTFDSDSHNNFLALTDDYITP